jgi:hypothetical protein
MQKTKFILECNALLSNQFMSKPITQKYSKLNERFGEAAHMSVFPMWELESQDEFY